jgi:hypothetical protein
MSMITSCPLCGAARCSIGTDGLGAFLLCPNLNCPPNAAGGKVADWYVSGDEERKILRALFPEEAR